MELQLIMETSTESIGGAVWLTSSLSPTYQQISSGDDIADKQASLNHEETLNSHWEDKQLSLKSSPAHQPNLHHNYNQQKNNNNNNNNNKNNHDPDSPLSSCDQSPEHKLLIGESSLHSSLRSQEQQSQVLKRRGNGLYQQQQHKFIEPERKLSRKNGYIGSNGSHVWSTQIEELTEHLETDYDSSLSALAASDLATAVVSYNMSEALLALPSLTVFKQEAPSPENQHNNIILNHVTQRADQLTINGNNHVEADTNNNGQSSSNLDQLIYTSNNYSSNSSCANHVSSSQQGNELNKECRFQYVLVAPTSIATKVNEETLTYLNQGQSYEIKFKKLSDLSTYRAKILKSTIRICFHERRLQYTERQQILAWQRARPGERLLEVDLPLSYGMIDINQPLSSNNSVDFTWDSSKDIGCYIKINCISTEFTPKKHGGEKGVPFRIQVETHLPNGIQLHAASCQVKVFKLKGADRKHKQDRDKIQRQPPHEQNKYQPSYDCTVLSDIRLDTLSTSISDNQNIESPYSLTYVVSPQNRAAIRKSPSSTSVALALPTSSGAVPNVPTSESIKEDIVLASALPLTTSILTEPTYTEINIKPGNVELAVDANALQTSLWLRAHHFHAFHTTFASFSAADILRLSRDDLIQICGLADGIRLYNALHARELQPKLSLYFALESSENVTTMNTARLWRVVYLKSLTSASLSSKLLDILGFSCDRLHSILILGPQGIHVLVTNERK